MRKLGLLVIIWLSLTFNALAYVDIGENYTGNAAHFAADYPSGSEVPGDFSFLGGNIGNNRILMISREFTVSQYSTAHYLSISGIHSPNPIIYDTAKSAYNSELNALGYTNDEKTELLKNFVGESQSMSVDFQIIKGSVPYRPTITPRFIPIPGDDIIATGKYTFLTDNSKFDKQFSDILVPLTPFETPLEPNQDYWVRAINSSNFGTELTYNTKLVGDVTTPEPSTLLLLGGGLLAAFRKKLRRN